MAPGGNGGRRGRYHHGDLRRALLDAALQILLEGGQLALRAVARKAGVSHAAPYHHFADRRELVAAIAAEGLQELREALLAAVHRNADDPALAFLEVGVAYVRFAVANPAHFRVIFSAELSDRRDLPELEAAYQGAYSVLEQGIRSVAESGATDEEIRLRALSAWSLVHGAAHLILDSQVGREFTPEEAEELARELLRRAPSGPHPGA